MTMDAFPSTEIFFSLPLTRRIPDLAIPVIRQEFYTKQELLTLREHLDSTPFLLAWPVLLIFILYLLMLFFVLCFGHNATCVDGLFFRLSLTLTYVRIVTLHIIQLFNVLYNSVELNIVISKLMNPLRANNQTQ